MFVAELQTSTNLDEIMPLQDTAGATLQEEFYPYTH